MSIEHTFFVSSVFLGLLVWLVVLLLNPRNFLGLPPKHERWIIHLQDTAKRIEEQPLWSLSGTGQATYNYELLSEVLRSLLDTHKDLQENRLQVKRFVGRFCLQIAGRLQRLYMIGEKQSELSSEVVIALGHELAHLAEGAKQESAVKCFQPLCRAYFLVVNKKAPRDDSDQKDPEQGKMYVQFAKDTEMFLHEFFDQKHRPALDAFLKKWQQLATTQRDPYVFAYVSIVQTYQRSFYFLKEQRDVIVESGQINGIKDWTTKYTKALLRDDQLTQYKAFCELMTVGQKASRDESERSYICRPETRR